ncbi:hypothetical protein L2E82_43563 [Cichorium intybus]|uniref:Uncharacterized protein n=1 Tax=Cichorium intybus TaxID=13427 RepID=A0ACB8ZP40_CICIN|nr:hypothetical protein L2E82_43563 [Cichorium intybus]
MDSSPSSSSSTGLGHVRSISLPSRSHPSTLKAEEELTSLQTWEASSSSMATVDKVCGSLVQLGRLYISINDLFGLSLTQQATFYRKDDKLVDEFLDRLMWLLDACGSIKDAIEQVKEHLVNVQSALRRKKEDLSVDAASLIRKMKDAKRSIAKLKQIDKRIRRTALVDKDDHLSAVTRSLRDTSALSVSIFGSLLSLKSIFVPNQKFTKWSKVLSLIHKGKTVTLEKPQISNEALESHIAVVENSLEGIFRTLIKTKVSLLNIRSR